MSRQQEQEITQQIYDFFSELKNKYHMKLYTRYDSGDCMDCGNPRLHIEKLCHKDYYSIDIQDAIAKGKT